MSTQYYEAVGRRKTASARVRLFPGGTGNLIINDKSAEEYMPRLGDLDHVMAALRLVGQEHAYNITVKIDGGGISGQAGAIRLGIARALLKVNPDFRPVLRKAGLLTRDPRAKERKKPGLKRARKAPTYTKR
jgi:small subunit ribosomal protein S9